MFAANSIELQQNHDQRAEKEFRRLADEEVEIEPESCPSYLASDNENSLPPEHGVSPVSFGQDRKLNKRRNKSILSNKLNKFKTSGQSGRERARPSKLNCFIGDQSLNGENSYSSLSQGEQEVEFEQLEQKQAHNSINHNRNQIETRNSNLTSIFSQLFALICVLLVLIYLLNSLSKLMTNLLSKILGGERRRSLASSSQQNLNQLNGNSSQQQQQQNNDTLTMPRNSSATSFGNQRRASRTSLHSVSAALFGALTGANSSSCAAAGLNGRSIIAKNKEDTVIIASSSQTIIQKDSTDSVASAVVSSGAAATSGGAPSVVSNNPQSPAILNSIMAAHAANQTATAAACGVQANQDNAADAELVLADQTLYDSVIRQQPQPMSPSMAITIALAACQDPSLAGASHQSLVAQQMPMLPSVATQIALETQWAAIGQQQASTSGPNAAPTAQANAGTTHHAPLNATNTMKQAPSVASSPTITAKNLNNVAAGDYETYTRLCDPHMTSFEPENLGNLIDNMEFRRLNLDQLKQFQFQQQIQSSQQLVAISAASAAATGAAAAAATASSAVATSASGPAGKPVVAPTKAGGDAVSQQIQQIAMAAASSALANLQLNQPKFALTPPSPLALNTCRQYSIVLNPSVYLLGEEAATIAYTKLSQLIDLQTGVVMRVELSEETRVWHRKSLSSTGDVKASTGGSNSTGSSNNKWFCVHLHRSVSRSCREPAGSLSLDGGPQTNVSLLRSASNQQQLASMQQMMQQQSSLVNSVPLISLNHSLTGNSQASQLNQSASSSNNSSSR